LAKKAYQTQQIGTQFWGNPKKLEASEPVLELSFLLSGPQRKEITSEDFFPGKTNQSFLSLCKPKSYVGMLVENRNSFLHGKNIKSFFWGFENE
jgi:hypothetical protein